MHVYNFVLFNYNSALNLAPKFKIKVQPPKIINPIKGLKSDLTPSIRFSITEKSHRLSESYFLFANGSDASTLESLTCMLKPTT